MARTSFIVFFMSHFLELSATTLFCCALLHTFGANFLERYAHRYPKSSLRHNLFHLGGEIEVVFGFWAALFVGIIFIYESAASATQYLESLDFREPIFVFVVMAICATKPVHDLAAGAIHRISRYLPFGPGLSFYVVTLSLGSILGSFITEPAAMTLCALLLKEHFYDHKISRSLQYTTLAVLFVNISIGGTLTHFAAPPVLMVATKWNWGMNEMFAQFGWKAIVAIFSNTAAAAWLFRKELQHFNPHLNSADTNARAPFWLIAMHMIFLALIVASVHHSVLVLGFFLLFLGLLTITQEYQRELALKNALLVAFFLAGLVVLGSPQRWWLKPILDNLESQALFMGATALTAITDNAAITFLAGQSETLSQSSKYAVLAGAVAGGGLTVIANAPNPAAVGILKSCFGAKGLNPISLFLYALIPTLVAMLCFAWLPSL